MAGGTAVDGDAAAPGHRWRRMGAGGGWRHGNARAWGVGRTRARESQAKYGFAMLVPDLTYCHP
ncbi:hypothetical protein [Oryza sativa Japonica Group]|uniref:Uncharacterized protein n=1 Tax=Oryza sativa subsp. japonica TaxID=39947 RepID=Q5NBT8_ORYSJ|nr:hypothetical protein [Oryza sativa Japonica Group]BAE95787.1 hypothetical protein [Oryza sativa Japonica Group]